MERRKIAVTGNGEQVRAVAQVLALRDDARLVLLGEDAAPVHAAAGPLRYTARAVGPADWEEATGADLVVVCDPDVTVAAEQLARRCPDALLVVALPDAARACAALQAVLRWPRARVLGLPPHAADAGPWSLAAHAAELVDFVLADRRAPLDAIVQHDGEHGHADGFHVACVDVGGDGVVAFR